MFIMCIYIYISIIHIYVCTCMRILIPMLYDVICLCVYVCYYGIIDSAYNSRIQLSNLMDFGQSTSVPSYPWGDLQWEWLQGRA